MSLPNPTMSFEPFDALPASQLNDLVENIEALAAGTGLDADAVTGDKVDFLTLANPCAFSVYRNSSWTDGNGAYGLVTFDTEVIDVGNNYDPTTGKFTAPVNGLYQLNANVGVTYTGGSYVLLALYKNGSVLQNGDSKYLGGSGNTTTVNTIGTLLKLAAGDYIQVYHYGTGGAGTTGQQFTNFSGHFVSKY